MNERVTPIMSMHVKPRRGLSREDAAGYVGVGTTKFDELVVDGRMPKPFKIDGRVLWDLRKLDAAMDNLVEATAANPLDRLD